MLMACAVTTGPIKANNEAGPLQICWAMQYPEPKIIILTGNDAISGGILKAARLFKLLFFV